jgi:hypothetical protein
MPRKQTAKQQEQQPIQKPEPPTLLQRVWDSFDELLAAYAGGWSLDYAVEMHLADGEDRPTTLAVRQVINSHRELRKRWAAVNEARAAHHFEKAAEMAEKLEREDPKAAGDLHLKLAAKTAPAMYGDKATLALTGADGGPVESVVKLDPAEAYRRAMKK